MISEEQLEEWERVANAATPGPWDTAPEYGFAGRSWVYERTAHHPGDPDAPDTRMFSCDDKDAEFFASARDAVPALIAEVRRLRADLADAERGEAKYLANAADNFIKLQEVTRERDVLSANLAELHGGCDNRSRETGAR